MDPDGLGRLCQALKPEEGSSSKVQLDIKKKKTDSKKSVGSNMK